MPTLLVSICKNFSMKCDVYVKNELGFLKDVTKSFHHL